MRDKAPRRIPTVECRAFEHQGGKPTGHPCAKHGEPEQKGPGRERLPFVEGSDADDESDQRYRNGEDGCPGSRGGESKGHGDQHRPGV